MLKQQDITLHHRLYFSWLLNQQKQPLQSTTADIKTKLFIKSEPLARFIRNLVTRFT